MRSARIVRMVILGAVALGSLLFLESVIAAPSWGTPVKVESINGSSSEINTPSLEGCPMESPNGLMLFMATDRPGGQGGIDIWFASRPSNGSPWGAPVNAGPGVNSPADDFCPTPLADGGLYFVSARPGGCGGADLYFAAANPSGGWLEPKNLGCTVNSAAAEFSPSLVRTPGADVVLYFSSGRPGGFAAEAAGATPDHDIYYARMLADGSFASPVLAPGVNSAAEDSRPNVRADGLEIVFDSTRPGGLGGPDIWLASRSSTTAAWSAPENLGPTINSASAESRAALSLTGERLYFGSNRPGTEGNSDLYFSVRGGPVIPGAAPPVSAAVTPPSTGDAGLIDHGAGTAALILAALAGFMSLALLRRRAA